MEARWKEFFPQQVLSFAEFERMFLTSDYHSPYRLLWRTHPCCCSAILKPWREISKSINKIGWRINGNRLKRECEEYTCANEVRCFVRTTQVLSAWVAKAQGTGKPPEALHVPHECCLAHTVHLWRGLVSQDSLLKGHSINSPLIIAFWPIKNCHRCQYTEIEP